MKLGFALLALLGLAPAAFGAPADYLPITVANTTALQALSTVAAQGGLVIRTSDGMSFVPSGSACPISGGNGITQIPSADSLCWLATVVTGSFPSSLGTGNAPVLVQGMNIGNYLNIDKTPGSASPILEGYECALNVPGSYTQQPYPPSCFASYVETNQTNAGASVAALFGVAAVTAPGANANGAWYVNGNLNNKNGAQSFGNDFGALVGAEFDYNVIAKSGAVAPTGNLYGVVLKGSSNTVPTGMTAGFDLFPLNTVANTQPWQYGYRTEDAAISTAALSAGTTTTANNVPSQTIDLRTRTSGGTNDHLFLQADAANVLHVFGTNVPGQLVVGLQTHALDVNASTLFWTGTNKDLEIRGPVDLTSGMAIESLNDALNALQPLEIIGSAIQMTGPTVLQQTTVAGLPACSTGTTHDMYVVTDANGPTYNGTLTGGGTGATAHVIAFCNGTNWTAH